MILGTIFLSLIFLVQVKDNFIKQLHNFIINSEFILEEHYYIYYASIFKIIIKEFYNKKHINY